MFRSRTVIVLGAGASNEIGLPLGLDLQAKIASKINISFDRWGSQFEKGDQKIYSALEKFAGRQEANEYLKQAWALSSALQVSPSIDTALNTHRDNERACLIGKMGIVSCILEAERSSGFYVNRVSGREQIGFAEFNQTFYAGFFRLLIEGTNKTDLVNIFGEVRIVDFNYDRSFEHYLFHALQTYFGISVEEATKLMANLVVHRPYGSVGRLPWQTGAGLEAVGFGQDRPDLIELSKQIRTFYESTHEEERSEKMLQDINEAEFVVFLGFAFHTQNMELLFPKRGVVAARKVLATAHGISEVNRDQIKVDIIKALTGNRDYISAVTLRHDLKCGAFFQEFKKILAI